VVGVGEMLREAEFGQEERSRRPGGPQQLGGPQERNRPAKSGRLGKIERAKVVERAWEAFYTSRYREAESLFRQLLRGAEDEPVDAVCGLSAIRRALGLLAEAASLVEQARRYHCDDPSLRRELGYIAYDQRRYEDAAGIFAELVQEYPLSIRDRRWEVASLRRGTNYPAATAVLDAVPKAVLDHPELDIERGWIAYRRHKIQRAADFQRAADHFRDAKAHGAQADLFVPPLVTALLRLGRPDAVEQAELVAADAAVHAPLSSPIASAQADVQVYKGYPDRAINLLHRLGSALDEASLRQLVTLLHGADRDEEASEIFNGWLRDRCVEEDGVPTSASPSIIATWIEVTGRRSAVDRDEFCSLVRSARHRYGPDDRVPAVVAAAAICALRNVDKGEAMRTAADCVAQHPQEPDVLIEAAKTSFALGHYETALEELDRVIKKEPDHDRALQWRCRSMRRLGRWQELDAYLTKKIRRLDCSPRLRIELGWLRLAKNDYRRAQDAFCEALRLDRSSQQALFGKITALRRLQRWDDAWTVLHDWEEKWPRSNRRRLAAAMLKLDREDFDGAIDLFQRAGGVSGLLGQASVLTQKGEPEKAKAPLGQALEQDPDRPGPKIALAMLLVQSAEDRGQSTRVARECNEADWCEANQLCLDAMEWGAESDAAALACRAQLALEQGLPRAAESLLQEAMERNPYGTHSSVLASVLIGMHRIDEAVSMLNRRIGKNREDSDRRDGNGGDSSAYFQLYRALLARGDGKAALSALQAALALAVPPASDTLAVALAYELEEQGSSAEAEQLLRNRLIGRNTAYDDLLRLGLAWILLSRGDRAQSPAMLQEAAAQATQVIMYPDPRSATVRPEKIKEDALRCRGTVYYKLAEHERRPSERIRLAALARHDQGLQSRVAHEKAPRGSRWRVWLTPELDTGLRMVALMAALALTAALWVLHGRNQMIWTTAMVVSLTPLFIGVILLTALLPQLQSLKLAGLQAQTRETPDVPLPTSPSVVLPLVTEFAAGAHENFIDAVDVSDLVGTSSTPGPSGEGRSTSPGLSSDGRLMTMPSRPVA
jgi:tetratricopeptide (TPR) repeat protein